MSGILIILGYLLMFVGSLLILIDLFFESFLWGIIGLIFSPVLLVHVIKNWNESKNKFFIFLVGLIMFIIGKSI